MLKLKGKFRWQVKKDGVILSAGLEPNGIITASVNDILDTYFSNGSTESAWYLGLISNTGFSDNPATDSMASHDGWTEATNYSEGTRPSWSPGNSSGGVKTNATAVQFTISSEEALIGMFVTSDNVKDGVDGTLWATATFATGANTPPNGSTFKLFYELEAREG